MKRDAKHNEPCSKVGLPGGHKEVISATSGLCRQSGMGEKRPLRRLRVQQFAEKIVLFLEEIFY